MLGYPWLRLQSPHGCKECPVQWVRGSQIHLRCQDMDPSSEWGYKAWGCLRRLAVQPEATPPPDTLPIPGTEPIRPRPPIHTTVSFYFFSHANWPPCLTFPNPPVTWVSAWLAATQNLFIFIFFFQSLAETQDTWEEAG